MTTRQRKLVVSFHHNKACHIIICLVASLLENLLNKISYIFLLRKKLKWLHHIFFLKETIPSHSFLFFDGTLSCTQFTILSQLSLALQLFTHKSCKQVEKSHVLFACNFFRTWLHNFQFSCSHKLQFSHKLSLLLISLNVYLSRKSK